MIGFHHPSAFLAAGALLLLLLFSFWRRKPVETVVGTLRLWKEIPDRVTPLKTARRPRFSFSLLLQALSILAMVSALAAPFLSKRVPEPREITFVVDTSARLRAKGTDAPTRFEAGMNRARELAANLDKRDFVTVLAHQGVWRGNGEDLLRFLSELEPGDDHVDLSALLEARRPGSELWVLSDAPVENAIFLSAEGPDDNTGIVHLSLSHGKLFVRLVRSGTPAKITLEIAAGEIVLRQVSLDLEAGRHRWSGKIDPGSATRVRVRIREEDSLAIDNVAWLNRWSSGTGVIYAGRDHALLLRVLQSIPGVRLGKDGCVVSYRDASSVDSPAVFVDPPSAPEGFRLGAEFVPGSWNISDHPLTRHVRAGDLDASYAREVSGGVPLLHADGKCVAAVRGERIVLGFDLPPSGWATTPSFPIFWTNVFDFVRTSGGWKAIRTGEPVPAGKGERNLSLLDSRESDLKRVDPVAALELPPVREGAGQVSLAGHACLLALLLVLMSWWSDRAGR